MQHQNEKQNQAQIQWQYISRGLNSLLNSLNRLNSIDSEDLPKNYEDSKNCSLEVQQEIDNCITQILASTKEVKHYETLRIIKDRVATKILQWLALRKTRHLDIVDELCSILLYNCVDISKEVPERVQTWDQKISESELQKFSEGILTSMVELEKSIQQENKGRSPMLNEISSLKGLEYSEGLSRLTSKYPDLVLELKSALEK